MAAALENGELRAGDALVEGLAVAHRDDPIVAADHHEGGHRKLGEIRARVELGDFDGHRLPQHAMP